MDPRLRGNDGNFIQFSQMAEIENLSLHSFFHPKTTIYIVFKLSRQYLFRTVVREGGLRARRVDPFYAADGSPLSRTAVRGNRLERHRHLVGWWRFWLVLGLPGLVF